jgi:hypothetical protein
VKGNRTPDPQVTKGISILPQQHTDGYYVCTAMPFKTLTRFADQYAYTLLAFKQALKLMPQHQQFYKELNSSMSFAS